MVHFSLTTAFVATLLAATAFAGPIERENFVKVPIKKVARGTPNAASVVRHDQARLAAANLKSSKGGSSSSGTVENDVFSYIAPVQVGSQTFNLIVDTGSSNTWVGASTKFKAGSTGKSTGDSISVSYGSGQFSGTEYTDTVTFGGLTVKSQSVGVAKSATGFTGVDGILGVGPVDLTQGTVSGQDTVPTFLDNLYSEGQISSEVLGVSFVPESGSDASDKNGELTLGGTDSSRYTGSITYTPTLTSGDFAPYWGIKVSSITFGGSSLGSGSAIVDTGTTLIYIPDAAYKKFLSASGCKADSTTGLTKCTKKPTGSFAFTIGGKAFALSPAQYLVPQAQYSNWQLTGSAYYSYIGSGGSSGVDFIIGQKFLENYYSVFDTTNARVGFATAASSS